ncbi:protein NDR1-like [Argentina anserina]|uniref:protein NDR1-like n=1 Tax=Argentina anserina TaxID=57926 RepID=UPI0021762AF1|nr:protein NDR1-like [Potentilla anserina]XP_050367413.1 protein NDR1-like [Potentilla anserina]
MFESENKHFYLCILEILAVLGLLALVLWLSLRPKSPTYTIVDITIPNYGLENGTQNGSIAYILEIGNSNKDSRIYYDTSYLTFYYGQDKVAETTIAPFHQGRHKTRSQLGDIDANPQVWRAVRNSILNATAELKVTLLTKIRYKTWGIKSKQHGQDLQGSIPVGKDGKLSGKKKKIKLSHGSRKLRRSSLRLLD